MNRLTAEHRARAAAVADAGLLAGCALASFRLVAVAPTTSGRTLFLAQAATAVALIVHWAAGRTRLPAVTAAIVALDTVVLLLMLPPAAVPLATAPFGLLLAAASYATNVVTLTQLPVAAMGRYSTAIPRVAVATGLLTLAGVWGATGSALPVAAALAALAVPIGRVYGRLLLTPLRCAAAMAAAVVVFEALPADLLGVVTGRSSATSMLLWVAVGLSVGVVLGAAPPTTGSRLFHLQQSRQKTAELQATNDARETLRRELHDRRLPAWERVVAAADDGDVAAVLEVARRSAGKLRTLHDIGEFDLRGFDEDLFRQLRAAVDVLGVQLDYPVAEAASLNHELDDSTRSQLVQVLRTLVINSAIRGKADNIWLSSIRDGDEVTFRVVDEGTSPPEGVYRHGTGLTTAQQFAEHVGGRFAIRARTAGGTEAVLAVPVPATSSQSDRPRLAAVAAAAPLLATAVVVAASPLWLRGLPDAKSWDPVVASTASITALIDSDGVADLLDAFDPPVATDVTVAAQDAAIVGLPPNLPVPLSCSLGNGPLTVLPDDDGAVSWPCQSPTVAVGSVHLTYVPPADQEATVTLEQGRPAPTGYWYVVEGTGFTPGQRLAVLCHDSVGTSFESETFVADDAGAFRDDTLCFSGAGPDHWVTVIPTIDGPTLFSEVVPW